VLGGDAQRLGQLVYRAYSVGSEAVRDSGMLGAFPGWFAPSPDSAAIVERTLCAEAAGFEVERFWTDEREYFGVHYLTVA